MKKAILQLETLTCPSCMQKITNAVKQLPGVETDSIQVLFNSSKIKLDFNETLLEVKDIEKAVTAIGYDVIKSSVK